MIILNNDIASNIDKLNKDVLPADTKIIPYYDRADLISYATETVLHNLLEGVLLVVVLISLFLFNWRATFIVALIIPLSLLFAFICLHLMGMRANLLSLGAVDFGIILDGTIVMVEGMFVILDEKSRELGMLRFNNLSKLGIIKKAGSQIAKRPFFLNIIIITALLPIFAFEKVEGKMFSPLAYTLGFALLGSLITTLTLVPVLISLLLNKNVKEAHNPMILWLKNQLIKGFEFTYKRPRSSAIIAFIVMIVGLSAFRFLGSEFLPQLNEGSIWLRVQLPYSASLNESVEVSKKIRRILMDFPQVKYAVSQTGRPDDGTDVAGFYNNEFDVILYPQSEWNPKISKEELVDQMNKKLQLIPGVNLNFSQPIMDNVEEAVSGVKGSICVKVYGDSLNYAESKVNEIYNILKQVKGVQDLGIIKSVGLPELDINLDQQKMALYGVATLDANASIAMAIGGVAASTLYEGIKTFDIRIRFPENFRQNPVDIGNLLVPTQNGSKVPIKEIATITQRTGPCLVFRDNNQRYCALKFSVRGRDMGSTIKEAEARVNDEVKFKRGYSMVFQGDFENLQRAQQKLVMVVPISLLLIFILLFTLFGNFKDSLLVFLNVPFAIVGGIFSLLITNTHFSISAGIGFICLFGICIQDGIILITVFKENLTKYKGGADRLHHAIRDGVAQRIRPVLMTALMAAIGLLPAALSYGIGSESSRPLARVVIGGILCAMFFSLWIFPIIFRFAYRKTDR